MGTIDLFQSRRTTYEKCLWWPRTTIDGTVPLNEIAHCVQPGGFFYAEEAAAEEGQMMQTGEFRHSVTNVSIMTHDDVYDQLHENDLVLYDRKIWRIVSTQLRREWRQSGFSKRNRRGTTIIVLKS